MGTVLILVGAVFSIMTLVCHIIILIHAFKSSVGEGFLCLCVPCYIIYYMFSKFDHPKKGLIIGLWWTGNIIGNGLSFAGQSMNASSSYPSSYGGGY
jgi:benzodiazapine receptor